MFRLRSSASTNVRPSTIAGGHHSADGSSPTPSTRAQTAAFAPSRSATSALSRSRPRRNIERRATALALVILVIGLTVGGVLDGASRAPTTATIPTTTRAAAPALTQPATSPVPAPATTLRPGDSGTQVRALQQALARLGYSPGSLDAQYGAATQSAVARFQRSSGLTPDGILGPKSLSALDNALKGQ